MKFYMHQRIIGENLIKIGLILSAQWRFSEERYQACPVTLTKLFSCGTDIPQVGFGFVSTSGYHMFNRKQIQ